MLYFFLYMLFAFQRVVASPGLKDWLYSIKNKLAHHGNSSGVRELIARERQEKGLNKQLEKIEKNIQEHVNVIRKSFDDKKISEEQLKKKLSVLYLANMSALPAEKMRQIFPEISIRFSSDDLSLKSIMPTDQ